LAKEIEGAGIPVAQITSLPNIAMMANSNRMVKGNGIIHPMGDASLPPDAEITLRRKIVRTALEALQADIEKPQLFK